MWLVSEILAANSSSFSEAHKKTLNSHFSVEDCVRGPFKNTAYSDKESRGVCGDLPYNFDEERRNQEDRNAKNVSGTSFWSNNRNERNEFLPETRDVSPFNPQRGPLIPERSPLNPERSSLEQYGSSNNQQAKSVSGSSFWSKSRFERNEFRPETRDISPVNPQRNPIIPERITLNFKRGSLEQYGSPNNQEAKNVSGSSFWSENRFEKSQLSPKTRDVSPKVNPQRSLFIPETNPLNRERSSLEQYGSSNNQQQRNQFRFETREVSLLNPRRSPFIRERNPLNSERNSLEQYGSSSNQQDTRHISVDRRTLLDEIIDFEAPQDNSGNGIAPLMTQSTQDDSGNNIEILDFKPPQDNSGNGIAPSKVYNYGPIPKGCVRVKMWIDKSISFSDPLHILRQLSQQNSCLRTKSWTVLDVKNNPKTGSIFLLQLRQEHLTVLRSFNMAPCIQKKKTLFKVLQPGEELNYF
uniref:Uncharacterized protein LOC114329641 n=1 Tax=Diabrotica virgifera virgifera TaxID=50390 RepID=A0A6P7FF16_DIAVI